MTTRILSDLHYGHPASYLKKLRALTPLLEGVDHVVFNGDSVERRFTKEEPQGDADYTALQALCAECGVSPTFLTGNHDPFLTELHHLDLADGAVLITHGDILFPGLSPWSRDAEILRRAQIEELALAGNPRTLEPRLIASRRASLAIKDLGPYEHHLASVRSLGGFLQEIWPLWRPLKILGCWAQTPSRASALATRYRPEARTVVIGHTHRAGVWRTGGRLIVNTGSFLPLSGSLAVDVTEKEIIVRKILHHNGSFTLGREIERRPVHADCISLE